VKVNVYVQSWIDDYSILRHSGSSGVASRKIWGAKMFDIRRITPFCLENRLSKYKITIFSKKLRGH